MTITNTSRRITAADESRGINGLNVSQAMCAKSGFDPEMWFPNLSDKVPLHNAKFVCGLCVLQEACAEQASDNKFDGVWGGSLFRNGKIVG